MQQSEKSRINPGTSSTLELLHTQTNASETNENKEQSGKQLIRIDKVPGTPFTVINNDETRTAFIAIGDQKVSEEMGEDEAYTKIEERDWELISNAIIVFAKNVYEAGKMQEALQK